MMVCTFVDMAPRYIMLGRLGKEPEGTIDISDLLGWDHDPSVDYVAGFLGIPPEAVDEFYFDFMTRWSDCLNAKSD